MQFWLKLIQMSNQYLNYCPPSVKNKIRDFLFYDYQSIIFGGFVLLLMSF